MPRFGPIKRSDLIRYLKQAGFAGPYSGGKHRFMIKGDIIFGYPIPVKATLVRDYYPGYCVRLE